MTAGRFRTGAASHVGMVRTMNEDAFVVSESVFAVADGMGGHLAGEVASAMAIEKLAALDGALSVDDVVGAVYAANHDIIETSRTDASRRGMDTTLTVVAAVHPDSDESAERELAVVNLGDSRTYRYRGGRLDQLTVDHSYVQELVAAGHLTADEARYHPQRNIVTRALGIEAGVGVDVWSVPIVRGDRYVLCSDGLVDEVTDGQIAEILAHCVEPQDAADELVAMANRSGGRDNVTVIVVDVVDGAEPERVPEPDVAPPAGADTEGEPDAAAATGSEPDSAAPIDETAALARPDTSDLDAPDSDSDTDVPDIDAVAPDVDAPVVPKRRVTSMRLIGALGGVALVVGIALVALRDENSPATPTTVVTTLPVTTAPLPTAPPVTTVTPVTALTPTTSGR